LVEDIIKSLGYLCLGSRFRRIGERLQAEGAEAVLLDCISFTERHRDSLAVLDTPVILSNAVVAKAVGELFGG